MNGTALLYLLPYLGSLAISAGVARYCWRHRAQPGARPYAWLALGQAAWTFGYLCELATRSLEAKIFWDNVQYIGGAGWILGLVAFTFQYIYPDQHIRRIRALCALLAVPLLAFVGLAFIDSLHGLMRANSRLVAGSPFSGLVYDTTPTFWLSVYYSYGIYAICLLVLLAKFARAHRLYRVQVGLILLGNLMPLVGTSLTLVLFADSPYRDSTPIMFAVGDLIVAWALFRYQLFKVAPVARSTIVESMQDAVFVLDPDERVIDVNPAASQLIGREARALIGLALEQVFESWPAVRGSISPEHGCEVGLDRAGEQRVIEVKAHTMQSRRGRINGHVLIMRDISRRKRADDELRVYRERLELLVEERTADLLSANSRLVREMAEREALEEQFRQAQKMEAIGRLAGGVAHDFNNLLTAIMGYTGLLLDEAADDSPTQHDLLEVLKAAKHATALTQQLLAFSRKQVLQPRVISLNSVIGEMEMLLRRLIGEDIDLIINLRPNIGQVRADAGQIQQVVMNLVVNARDAVGRGGRIQIETANVELDELYARTHVEAMPGKYVMIAVSDTGKGIDQTTMPHLFEPFFTTKERGKGTGLGLATIHGIVKQSGGQIYVYSEPGQGATFKIYLPLTDGAPEVAVQEPRPPALRTGSETILLIEDDEGIRELIQRLLSQQGYTVLLARHTDEAVRIAAEAGPIDLLISDVVVPGSLTSHEVAGQLIQRQPSLRVLYISGYTDDDIASRGMINPEVNFLQKPFTARVLIDKIHELMPAVAQGS
jgi:PAS domain S-box-containing protein